jgi:flagellar assembly protein FliH
MNERTRIIRADRHSSGSAPPSVVRADVYQAQLSAAHARAAELERIRARAHAEGFAAGSALAAKELLAIAGARATALREGEKQLERAVLLVAGALVGRTIEADPALIAHLVEPLVARLRRAQRVMVRVHPDDTATLAARLPELRRRTELEGALEIVGDPALARGDCSLESDLGDLDARISTRLSELARTLGWEAV